MRMEFSVIILFLSCPVIYAVENSSKEKNELIFVHILFRHGDRSIINTYPNDPWKSEIYWKDGFGQLTNLGRQQHYELGAYLRRRYFNLIGNNGSYHKDNIYVRSTDVDRTLSSAAHNLAGMFPPSGDQVWNDSLLWRAIPIHTIRQDDDYVLAMKKPCSRYDKAFEDYKNSPEIKTILKNNQSLIEYIEAHAGKSIHSICEVKTIYQALWVESLKDYPLPSWTDKVFVPGSDMERLANFCFSMATNTKLLARLKTGWFFKEVFGRFTSKKDSTLDPDRSLWIYSAHDTTISNVLNALGLFEPMHIPIYASSVFFELHKFNGSFHVEIYYKRDRGEDEVPLKPLFIPNCGEKCPLEKLYEIYNDILPTQDFKTECRLPETTEYTKIVSVHSSSNTITSSYAFIFGFIVLLIIN